MLPDSLKSDLTEVFAHIVFGQMLKYFVEPRTNLNVRFMKQDVGEARSHWVSTSRA